VADVCAILNFLVTRQLDGFELKEGSTIYSHHLYCKLSKLDDEALQQVISDFEFDESCDISNIVIFELRVDTNHVSKTPEMEQFERLHAEAIQRKKPIKKTSNKESVNDNELNDLIESKMRCKIEVTDKAERDSRMMTPPPPPHSSPLPPISPPPFHL